MTTPRRRILIVAYYYPPRNITGARRPHALAKWLRRAGHEVAVVTSANMGPAVRGEETALVQARDLLATRLNWRPQSLDVVTGKAPQAAWAGRATAWGLIVVPDIQLISWMPFAAVAAARLARRFRPDVVITTSPVESAHGVGLALQRLGIPWIVDLRDGWCFESPREPWPLGAQRRLDRILERLVVRRADAVVTVTEPLSQELSRRLGVPVETITNGFDPDDEPAELPAADLDPRKLSLVHTGSLGRERTLVPVLDALVRLAAEDPAVRDRVEVVVAGPQTAEEQALYARADVAPFVRHVGFLDRPASLALQRRADLLLLVTTGVRTGEATGKLFEYFAAGRPILVLGDRSAAATMVEEAAAGWAIPPRDADAAERALRRLLSGDVPTPPDAARASYLYPALAERYAALIERTVARRAAGGGARGSPAASAWRSGAAPDGGAAGRASPAALRGWARRRPRCATAHRSDRA